MISALNEALSEMQLWLLGQLTLLRITVPKPTHKVKVFSIQNSYVSTIPIRQTDYVLGEPHRCRLCLTEIIFSKCISPNIPILRVGQRRTVSRCVVFGVVRKRWWGYIVLHLLALLFIHLLSCAPDFYSQNDNLLLLYIVFPRITGQIPRKSTRK